MDTVGVENTGAAGGPMNSDDEVADAPPGDQSSSSIVEDSGNLGHASFYAVKTNEKGTMKVHACALREP